MCCGDVLRCIRGSLSRAAELKIVTMDSAPNPTLERTRASRFGRAEFVCALRLARAAHGDRYVLSFSELSGL